MIKPTIGRVVWFWPLGSKPENDEHQPYPALVTFVHNEYVVNLAVFDRNGDIQPRQNVQLFQGDPGEGRPQEPHCEWMPYQKGQAAKTEINYSVLIQNLSERIAALEALVKAAADARVAYVSQPPPPATNAGIPVPPLASSNSTNTVPRNLIAGVKGEDPRKDGTGVG